MLTHKIFLGKFLVDEIPTITGVTARFCALVIKQKNSFKLYEIFFLLENDVCLVF